MPPLRKEVKLFTVLSLWIIFAAGYFSHFPLFGFIGKIYLLLLAGLVTASAAGYGSFCVKRFGPIFPTPSEFLLFSTIIGFGTIALLMMLAGMLGFWTRAGALTLVIIGLLLGWPHFKRFRPLQPSAENSSWGTGLVPIFLISLGVLTGLLLAFCPPIYYDSLVYHFALPQAYIQAAHWVGQRELIYSAFPQNMEMVWTLGMLLAGDVLANLLGWIISLLGIFAVYLFAKRYFGTRTALWAAALLSVMPAYLLLGSGGYIDVGLTVFSFASFYALCLWTEKNSLKMLAIAGFLAGCAMGTKYTGAIPFVIGVLIILYKTPSRTFGQVMVQKIVYGSAALAVFSPWLIKNLYYVGNPVFPFFYHYSFKTLNPWMGQAAAGYFRGLTEYAPRSGWTLLKLVWDITVHGSDFGGGMDVLGNLGWAPLFALLPAVWLAKKKSSVLSLALLYAVCFFIPWGMSRPVLRFLLPLAPLLALAAAYGYDHGIGGQTKGVRFAAQIFLAFLLLSNAQVFLEVSDALSLFRVPLGFEARTDYLSRALNYFDAASFVNTLPADSLTYVVGDQRGYYYNRPVLVTPVFNKNPLTEWANDAASSGDLALRLKAQGVTHLLVNNSEMARLDRAYDIFSFTPKGRSNWEDLLLHRARSVYHDAHCEIFALP